MSKANEEFLAMFNDETLGHRLYVLDTLDGGMTEVVASGLLTNREAMRRLLGCSRSRCPMVVGDRDLDARRRWSGETTHSELGSSGMLWEILGRARDKRIADEK